MNLNSMYHWLPAVKKARAPYPHTILVRLGYEAMMGMLDGKPMPLEKRRCCEKAAAVIGFPLFLRTDLASGKHNWRSSCFVPTPDVLWSHIGTVIDCNAAADMMGLPMEALAFREFIPLEHSFTAFDGMPVARERRYFATAGRVLCHHPYWPEDALSGSYHQPMLPQNWQSLLREINHEGPEVEELSVLALRVSQELDGAWSIDFARAASGKWYLIDMALAGESWHPDHAAAVPA